MGQETTLTQLGDLSLEQPREGYRFNIDSVLLAHFASLKKGPVVDLGAGSGILGLLLARRGHPGPFVAVELDRTAAGCCARNYLRHALEGRVLCQDLAQDHEALPRQGFMQAISNPPYGRAGAGRVNPRADKARARHELELAPGLLWRRAAELLNPGGRFAFCLPPGRLPEAFAGLQEARLAPKRLRLVHGRVELACKVVLVEAVKEGRPGLEVEPPLVVYADGERYTEEVAAIYHRLCGL